METDEESFKRYLAKEGVEIGAYIFKSNPPTFSEIYAVMNIINNFKMFYIIIPKIDGLMQPVYIGNLLQVIFRNCTNIDIIILDLDFRTCDSIPTSILPKIDMFITSDERIYTNISYKQNIKAYLVPKLSGWDDVFMQNMYERSLMLQRLKAYMSKNI